MKFQLVIQFPGGHDEEDFDLIANLEDRLDESLEDAEVDGHDIGSGEINIFIHTNDPRITLFTTKEILEEEQFDLAHVKIAYREIGAEKYIPLWPENLVEFKVI
jgi:hypothetical protein